jgi:hypothetical protein
MAALADEFAWLIGAFHDFPSVPGFPVTPSVASDATCQARPWENPFQELAGLIGNKGVEVNETRLFRVTPAEISSQAGDTPFKWASAWCIF